MNWIERATRTLELESQAIAQLVGQLDEAFEAVGQLILERPGRVIMTGIGKSAIIAQKLVATFNSTGTPAVFDDALQAFIPGKANRNWKACGAVMGAFSLEEILTTSRIENNGKKAIPLAITEIPSANR